MLEDKRASAWKRSYDIIADGRRYEVRANMWGNKHGMVDEFGTPIASADRVGRKNWTVEAGSRTYEFRRASWRHDQELHFEGRCVGSVKRISAWRGGAVADLPGLPLPVEVCAVLAPTLAAQE